MEQPPTPGVWSSTPRSDALAVQAVQAVQALQACPGVSPWLKHQRWSWLKMMIMMVVMMI